MASSTGKRRKARPGDKRLHAKPPMNGEATRFVPGDPRINRKGQPKGFNALRRLALEIAQETAVDDKKKPIMFDGKRASVAEMVLRAMTHDRKSRRDFLEIAYGKLPSAKDDSGGGEALEGFALPADVLAAPFVNVYRAVKDHVLTEFLLKGGRGSTKSTAVALLFIFLIITNPGIHGLAMRQVADTLRDSVYNRLVFAIGLLGLQAEFKCTTSPMEITYKPTGQKIYFRGADDEMKLKSITPPFGYIGILWLEELDQFRGPEAMRSIEQSVLRGGPLAWEFLTYNPPKTISSWVNVYASTEKPGQYKHHSTYLDVPQLWLGPKFIDDAEHLKALKPKAYEHEYMGIPTGSGGAVFDNLEIRAITDEEIHGVMQPDGSFIGGFDRVTMGIDWGWFPDPFVWGKQHYDAARMTLYIYDELYLHKTRNDAIAKKLKADKKVGPGDQIIADSASPKDVADLKAFGLNVRGAEKGPDSVEYSMKWLQGRVKIVIDRKRAPEHAKEFEAYELEKDKDGNFISSYPDKNNHCIDEARYGTNLIWRRRGE